MIWSPAPPLLESGRIKPNQPLGPYTWFRVGGPADWFFLPPDIDSLIEVVRHTPEDIPITTLGVGSNIIIRDGGIAGLVVRLMGKYWGTPEGMDNGIIRAPAASLDLHIAKFAAKHGLSGLGFLSGIPGSIGGAIRTNAGCYGRELADVLVAVEGVTHKGERIRVPRADIELTYRHSNFPTDIIITHVFLQSFGTDTPENLNKEISEHQARRAETQPIKDKTSGSTFANPIDPKTGEKLSAWKLIDEAGCRGLRVGGAMVSEKHCNFLINADNSTASDLEALGELVRQRVLERSGIQLRWEVRRIGRMQPT